MRSQNASFEQDNNLSTLGREEARILAVFSSAKLNFAESVQSQPTRFSRIWCNNSSNFVHRTKFQ